MSESDLKQQMI